jgi:aminomethyltransferase
MEQLRKTVFHDRHFKLGGKIVEFGGWEMPIQYSKGIVHEHLATRKTAGLFDVSHMGRFIFSGESLPFLQHVLSNNSAALEVGQSQYTFIPNETGGAIDDAYLYRFTEDEYVLVVNASNREKDWAHFESLIKDFAGAEMVDRTEDVVMLSVQGPESKKILSSLIEAGPLPEPMRNRLSTVTINSKEVLVARTGYTGEPVCFELFIDAADGADIWDLLTEAGAVPIGLGARDTLRLEAGLPLYGHELGIDINGREIPIFACGLARFAVSFSLLKGDFVGRAALSKQFAAFKKINDGDYSQLEDLRQMIRPVAVSGKGIARPGSVVFANGKEVGYVTSGTMVPYYKYVGEGLFSEMTDEKKMRSVCLALVDSDIADGERLEIEIRKKKIDAVIVPYHLRGEAPPQARPIVYDNLFKEKNPLASLTIYRQRH